ncbi:MAG: DUF1295 domain-containing protein [Vicinamibacterales bacterium]
MPDPTTLLGTLGLSLLVQAAFFVFAASLRTDKVTDLAYGLTFVLLAGVLLAWTPDTGAPGVLLTAMVTAWGVRLAGYLLYRIIRTGRDERFDGIREHVWKFLAFWTFQGVAVWLIMVPVVLWFGQPAPWRWTMLAGFVPWAIGLVIETVADAQKFAHKSCPGGRARWMDSGLWRLSRHPNYFGELLCWWGIWLFVAPDLGWLALPALIGPLAITGILLFGTGIPTAEASAKRKWGDDPEYLAYRARTPLLVPWPRPRRA